MMKATVCGLRKVGARCAGIAWGLGSVMAQEFFHAASLSMDWRLSCSADAGFFRFRAGPVVVAFV